MDDETGCGSSLEALTTRIAELQATLEDLQARMPAHSVPASMLLEIESVEDQLDELRRRLGSCSET